MNVEEVVAAAAEVEEEEIIKKVIQIILGKINNKINIKEIKISLNNNMKTLNILYKKKVKKMAMSYQNPFCKKSTIIIKNSLNKIPTI
jgi:hypothetical protein